MWHIQKTTNLLTRLIVTLVFVASILDTALALSDKRLCADENCQEIISMGRGIINYPAGEEGMVSFKINAPIRIISKSAGKDLSLWGIEVNGRQGYAPRKLIREIKIYTSEKNLKYIVDVVKPGSEVVPVLNSSENVVGQGDTIDGSLLTTTTTKPLDVIPVQSQEDSIVKNPVENASSEKPAEATPVLMEMVDGTQIPVLNENNDGRVEEDLNDSNNFNKIETQSEEIDDDDEIGDYDEDEEENLDFDNNEEEKLPEIEPKTLSSSNEINEIKTNEIKDEIKEINNTESNSDERNDEPSQPDATKYEELDLVYESTESLTQSDIPVQEQQPIEIQNTITSSTELPLSSVVNDAPQKSDNEIELEKLNENLLLQDLPQTSQDASQTKESETEKIEQKLEEQPQIDLQTEQQRITEQQTDPTNEQPITDSTLSTNEQPPITADDNLKVPLELDLIPTTLANQQQVPTESSQILEEENPTIDNTKEALTTASEQEKNINLNNSSNENLTDNKIDEAEQNQDNLYNEEKLVSNTSQEQYQNPEKTLEQLETQTNGETGKTNNIPLNHDSTYYPEATPSTESNLAQQLNTEPALLPQIVPENQEKLKEPALNESQTNIEIPSHTETEIPQTPTDLPAVEVLETESHQQPSTETNPAAEIPLTSTETPLNPAAEIPLTSTDSPLNLPSSSVHETDTPQYQSTEIPSSQPSLELNNDFYQQQTDQINPTPYNPYDDAPSNTPLPPQYDENKRDSPPSSSSTPSTEIPHYDYYDQQPTGYAPSDYVEHEVVTENPNDFHQHDQSSMGYGSIEPLVVATTTTTEPPPKSKDEEPKALPSLTTPFNEDMETKENKGLFATIMGTVNNIMSSNKRAKNDEHNEENDLDRILYPSREAGHKIKNKNEGNTVQYCEKLGPNGDCPHGDTKPPQQQHQHTSDDCDCSFTKSLFNSNLTFDTFAQAMASKILEISDLLALLAVVAAASLFFIFGYYCFCNSSREGALLSKLNQLESSLLATHKENAILKHNLMSTRQKLASIEDNSFGSNDMVVSLKTELEDELLEKARLQDQITNLQKELENAADAGIELNKIVSELLSNQTGDESIISSVEELQKQLNEQQNTILEINASLAEKSRENSELQLLIAEQNARYEAEIADLQRDNDELEQEKGQLQTRLEEIRSDFDKDITVALESKNFEIKRLQNEIVELSNKIENEHTKWQTSMAKVEALEECLRNVKRDPNVNINQVIDVANIRAELLDAQKKYATIKERLETQLDSRKLAENQLQIVSTEVEKLKQDFNQSEKDKLEAQTRLEVLSNYFKDKENQLQKELSLKEAMWLKQQGETTTTVDRLTAMKEEIQSLKSQNDSLRAEIEAQVAAHKAQTGTLENRAHETWLAARQSDRRYEESRAEATALRRKLTALAGGNNNEGNKPSAGSGVLGDELTNAPSPIHMESPGSPMLGRMPPPPFLPPPFMGPPPPFMGMPPPPPFVPPGEMRPAPLGRIMSPPPQRSGRFSPPRLDYDDYLDYEGNNTWHRHSYSPPPRTYRSLSPTDSRYDYEAERDLMSKYDTETDFSPPPSPRESRRRDFGRERGNNNNTRSPYNNSKKSQSGHKPTLSSGSEKSYNSSSHNGGKAKGGGKNGVGKSLV